MDTKNIKFVDTKTEKYKIHQYKNPINDKNNNKIVVSNKFSFGKHDFKYFISSKDNKETRPLCIFFAEMSMHKRYSDKTKCMYFMMIGEKSFDKYMIDNLGKSQ